MAQLATEQHPLPHACLEVVAQRSGGNPQFLRDLLRSAINPAASTGLPDSAEAAAMARIDALAPEDRALVRRAAVFGLTFHPRMLAWFDDEGDAAPPGPATWARLQELFDEEPDGYLRFRRSLLRDAAYEGLPYKLRRRLHGAVAARLEAEDGRSGGSRGHPLAALFRRRRVSARRGGTPRSPPSAPTGSTRTSKPPGCTRARWKPGAASTTSRDKELAAVHEALGDAWNRAGEFRKASEAYTAARRLVAGDPLMEAGLLLKRSRMEEKLGKYPQALRWAARARKALEGLTGPEAARQAAQSSAWYATVLQAEGRSNEAIRWAQRAIGEAEAVDDPRRSGPRTS